MRYDPYEIIRKYDTLQQIKLQKKKYFAYIIKSNAFHTAPIILLKIKTPFRKYIKGHYDSWPNSFS